MTVPVVVVGYRAPGAGCDGTIHYAPRATCLICGRDVAILAHGAAARHLHPRGTRWNRWCPNRSSAHRWMQSVPELRAARFNAVGNQRLNDAGANWPDT